MNKIIAFGDVDQASKQQLERCLTVSGEESRGVRWVKDSRMFVPVAELKGTNDVVEKRLPLKNRLNASGALAAKAARPGLPA